MVDIVYMEAGAIAMSLETAPDIMDQEQAKRIVATWVNYVQGCLQS